MKPPTSAALVEHLDQFQRRVVQDAVAEATAGYWLRRGDTFQASMPRAGDFLGAASPEDITAQRLLLAEVALPCRQRAAVSLLDGAR